MYINIEDNHNFKLLHNKSQTIIKSIINQYSKNLNRVSFCVPDSSQFLKVQDFLNTFAISKNLYTIDSYYYRIYKLIPNELGPITIHLNPDASFSCDRGDFKTIVDYESFLIDNFKINVNFATHVDDKGYLWRPDALTENWHCFLKKGWQEIDLEKHVELIPIL